MTSAATYSIQVSSNDKEKLDSSLKDLKRLQWEEGEYYFHHFVDYYQLPQIVRVEQTWNTNLVKNQFMYLHTFFDRYMIIASAISSSGKSKPDKPVYLIPDWFPGECKILSKNPVLKRRCWNFQGTFELYRFDLPRAIRVLADTPAHVRRKADASKHEWDKVVLRKNARLNVIRRDQYQSRVKNDKGELIASEPKDAFILQDPATGDEFILPPGVPLRFNTMIEDKELHENYRSHDGTFTFPEIMMRYEFPLDIEIVSHIPKDFPDFRPTLRLEKFCVAKSVLAFNLSQDKTELIELSPLTQFTLHCAKCLTVGLPRDDQEKEMDKEKDKDKDKSKDKEKNKDKNGDKKKDDKLDEKQFQRYEDTRTKISIVLDEMAEAHKCKIITGTPEEVDCVQTGFEISVKMKTEDDRPAEQVYLTLEEAIKVVRPSPDEIPFPKPQPKRFTVHASADPSNPYNEVIDFEDVDALNESVETLSTSKKESSKSKTSSSKKSSTDKPQKPTNQSSKRPALVVQQMPPPIMLPPESFERTVKAIPDKLYTDFVSTSSSKKTEKKEKSSKK